MKLVILVTGVSAELLENSDKSIGPSASGHFPIRVLSGRRRRTDDGEREREREKDGKIKKNTPEVNSPAVLQ